MGLSIIIIALIAGLWYVDSNYHKERIKKLNHQIQLLEKKNLEFRDKINALMN